MHDPEDDADGVDAAACRIIRIWSTKPAHALQQCAGWTAAKQPGVCRGCAANAQHQGADYGRTEQVMPGRATS